MDILDILSIITSIATFIGIAFLVYNKFHVPQEKLEKQQLITEGEIDNKASILAQKELETKALLLADQVRSKNEENEKRFHDMGIRLDTAMTTAQNHIHTVDVKVDKLIETVGIMTNKITELTTIINERIPKN
ncbi:MAG: hypothetical protein NTZ18_03605 [Candidatus Komeilibacteria bacterium]|nr:hypothetical protein [Candidatus Komeilibacteria bacterium]